MKIESLIDSSSSLSRSQLNNISTHKRLHSSFSAQVFKTLNNSDRIEDDHGTFKCSLDMFSEFCPFLIQILFKRFGVQKHSLFIAAGLCHLWKETRNIRKDRRLDT